MVRTSNFTCKRTRFRLQGFGCRGLEFKGCRVWGLGLQGFGRFGSGLALWVSPHLPAYGISQAKPQSQSTDTQKASVTCRDYGRMMAGGPYLVFKTMT